MTGLTDVEREILQFETDHPGLKPGRRADVAYERWGILPTRYHQVLQALLDRPEALEAFPTTVRRLTRLREGRAQERSRRWRLGDGR